MSNFHSVFTISECSVTTSALKNSQRSCRRDSANPRISRIYSAIGSRCDSAKKEVFAACVVHSGGLCVDFQGRLSCTHIRSGAAKQKGKEVQRRRENDQGSDSRP